MSRPSGVVVFGTCLIDLVYPEAGLAAMRLIRREGVRVRFPRDQSCCGQPAYNAGYREHARRVARQQLKVLDGDDPVVVPSASCAGMLREHYPRLFEGMPEQALAARFAARVVELCDFLHRMLAVRLEDHGPPVTVALHQSCSAQREMAVAPAAAALLGQLNKVTVVEPDHAQECCGFGGTFAVKEPEISAAMAADKTNAIAATGAELLVSQDCGCLMNLDGTASKAGLGFEARHIAEFLWQRTHQGDG